MSSSNPGAGGFQLDEKYEQQLADICTDFSNAIVAFSSACAAGTSILSNFSTLSDHDFSSETSAINNINTTTDEMVSTAATMALDFEALESALNQLDDYILNKLSYFEGLSAKEKEDLKSEYNRYKNGEITYDDFLQHLADLNNTDLISDMFGEYAGSYLAESLKYGGKITVNLLKESIIESSIVSVAERWGLDFFSNEVAYGFSAGISYGIADKLYELVQNAKGNKFVADKVKKFLGKLNLENNIYAGFWVNAVLISITNIVIDKVTGNLDWESGIRDFGDGVSCAASWAVGEYIIGLIEAGAISLGTGAVGGALIVAGVYVGCSKLVDIIADSIFNDANMNYDHKKLIEELKENGYILYDTLKIPYSDESVVDAYLRMKEEGAPSSLTNFLLGSSGLPYDTNYDKSAEFAAITYLCDGVGITIFPGDFTDEEIEERARMYSDNPEEQEAFINAAKEVRDYFDNHRTENNGIINDYLGVVTVDYNRNGGTFSVN